MLWLLQGPVVMTIKQLLQLPNYTPTYQIKNNEQRGGGVFFFKLLIIYFTLTIVILQ